MSIKYPKGETVWVQYIKDGEPVFIMTSKAIRDCYYLYQRADDGFKKLGRSKDPREMETKYEIFKKIGV